MSEILDVISKIQYDDSVTKTEYHTYLPFITSYNNSDEIRIAVQHQDLYILPCESFIYIEGSLTKKEGGVVDSSTLTNNCVSFLFDAIRYELNGVEIDRFRNTGITTTLKNYVSLNENESKMLYNAGWNPSKTTAVKNGHFNFSYR